MNNELVAKLNETQDVSEIEKVVALFNLDIQKKNLARSQRLSDIQDKVTEQIQERVTKHADEFSNKDLLDYFKVVQDTLTKSQDINKDELTQIVVAQHNEININNENDSTSRTEELSRASRNKVMWAVRQALKQAQLASINDTDNEQYELNTEESNKKEDNIIDVEGNQQ